MASPDNRHQSLPIVAIARVSSPPPQPASPPKLATSSTVSALNNHVARNDRSPYFLRGDENPGVALVPRLLTGSDNYRLWSRSMRSELKIRNKFRFVDGTIPVLPPDHVDYEAWERCNAICMCWIINSVDPSIAERLIWRDTAAAAWEDLRARYARVGWLRVAELQGEIARLKQGVLSVMDYYMRFLTLWGEYSELRSVPRCRCDGSGSTDSDTNCEAVKVFRTYQENDQVIGFYVGLNENIQSRIWLTDPVPSLSSVFSLACQHEQLLSNSNRRRNRAANR